MIRTTLGLLLVVLSLTMLTAPPLPACCPAPRGGMPVVNADQTVIIIWDPATKTQHFIRKASFKSEGDDFGFLVPTPDKPELSESGNDAFPYLHKLTEPEIKKERRPHGVNCSCATTFKAGAPGDSRGHSVHVLEEKLVAGFNAKVLQADSTDALVNWLKENEYAYSPEVAAWAKPYVEKGWKITALKVAKKKDDGDGNTVSASALRMSFKSDRPLFPYREPASERSAQALNAHDRLLRIYFIADARYRGELTQDAAWTGKVAWANKLSATDRKKTLELLGLPPTTGPADWWLTEFEDNWPYRIAPADVYFSRSPIQDTEKRPAIIQYTSAPWPDDIMAFALVGIVFIPPLYRRLRRAPKENA